jgi:hypothetical protein
MTELFGQIVLSVTADKKSGSFAMLFNTFSVLVSTLITALGCKSIRPYSSCLISSVAFHEWQPTVALVVSILAPLAKLIAGGSHAAAFLSYALLHEQASGPSR